MLAAGQIAPDFNVLIHDGGEVRLADFSGRNLVLFFYPKADTPACTDEAKGFSDARGRFAVANASILGISRDTVKKNAKFAAKVGIGIPLGCDPDGDVCQVYGTWVEKSMYGKKYMGIERTTLLIGPDKEILAVWNKVRVPGHIDEVLARIT